MAGQRTTRDRLELAEHRLRKVLRANTVCSGRTLENKISDAGPTPMRIDPHVLTKARRGLEEAGEIIPLKLDGMRWYHLATTPEPDVTAKLALLRPLHKELQDGAFLKRMGQCLEIAVFRALTAQPALRTLGAYTDLGAHDDGLLYTKEEPPAHISGRASTGRLDFIAINLSGYLAGIEVKNVREWLYPDRSEVIDLLRKCVALDIVPVLVARRIPFVTFKLLNACGAVVHQTYNQRFPLADSALADRAKNKLSLGFHDIRLGNDPDARLLKFTSQLPVLISTQRTQFDAFKDLLVEFTEDRMDYAEFAARVRRRTAGTNEDNDWPDDLSFGRD